jgi:hypothetical protein
LNLDRYCPACLASPALRRLTLLITKGEDAQALGAIREVLTRNELYAYGVEPQAKGGFNPAITVQTQVNMPDGGEVRLQV